MTMDASKPARLDFPGIQALRAYAAASVMIGHALKEWAHTLSQPLPFDVSPLLRGVDIFFVISGFIMYVSSRDDFGKPGAPGQFLLKRFIRIVPLYWIFTSLMIAVLLVSADSLRSTQFDWWNAVSSYLFVPSARSDGRVAPILSLGWTLNYEMFFYVLFAVCLFIRRRPAIIGLSVVMAVLAVCNGLIPTSWVQAKFLSRPIILEFVFGVWIGALWDHKRYQNLPAALALLAAGFVAICFSVRLPGALSSLAAGVPAGMIVFGAVVLPQTYGTMIPSWIVLLGDSSYALYLSHRFVLRAFTIAAGKLALLNNVYLYVSSVTVVAILLSVLIYTWLEVPVLAALKRVLLPPRQRDGFRPRSSKPAL